MENFVPLRLKTKIGTKLIPILWKGTKLLHFEKKN